MLLSESEVLIPPLYPQDHLHAQKLDLTCLWQVLPSSPVLAALLLKLSLGQAGVAPEFLGLVTGELVLTAGSSSPIDPGMSSLGRLTFLPSFPICLGTWGEEKMDPKIGSKAR